MNSRVLEWIPLETNEFFKNVGEKQREITIFRNASKKFWQFIFNEEASLNNN